MWPISIPSHSMTPLLIFPVVVRGEICHEKLELWRYIFQWRQHDRSLRNFDTAQDQLIPSVWFPIGASLTQTRYLFLSCFQDIRSNTSASRPWPLGSRGVIGHLTVRFAVGDFLYRCSIGTDSLISKGSRDIEAPMYLGRGFDLSRSREVIGHVIICLAVCGFL